MDVDRLLAAEEDAGLEVVVTVEVAEFVDVSEPV